MESEKYKLILGDCLEVMKTLPDASIDLCLTDPPYGTTACKWDSVIPFAPMWKELKRICKSKAAICLFGSQPFTSALVMSNPKGFRYGWIWEKNRGSNFAVIKYQPMKEHEDISVFSDKSPAYIAQYVARSEGGRNRAQYQINPSNTGKRQAYSGIIAKDVQVVDGDFRCPRSVLKFNTEVGFHPTQKPVELLRYLIRTYTRENETVLDFTMGSGSTGVAALLENRKFIGIELDASYYKIAQNRIEQAVNKEPLFATA